MVRATGEKIIDKLLPPITNPYNKMLEEAGNKPNNNRHLDEILKDIVNFIISYIYIYIYIFSILIGH